MIKRIHVNQLHIKKNMKDKSYLPVISVKAAYNTNIYGHEVRIKDGSGKVIAKVVYQPDKPLACGAKVWIETEANIDVVSKDFLHNETVTQM